MKAPRTIPSFKSTTPRQTNTSVATPEENTLMTFVAATAWRKVMPKTAQRASNVAVIAAYAATFFLAIYGGCFSGGYVTMLTAAPRADGVPGGHRQEIRSVNKRKWGPYAREFLAMGWRRHLPGLT